MLNKNLWGVIAFTYTVFVLVISLVQIHPPKEISVPLADKCVHGAIYFVFTVLWSIYLSKYQLANYLALVVAFAFMLGLIIELLQHYVVQGRACDVWDVLANCVGIIFAVFLLKKASKRNVLKVLN